MNFLSRIFRAVQNFREAFPTVKVDTDDNKWVRVSDESRDLTPASFDRGLQMVWYLFEANPMAKRLINMTAEYVVSEGVTIKAQEAAVQEIIDAFWTENQLDHMLLQYAKELGLWGEQCYRAFVNHSNGAVILGYIDPGTIKEVNKNPGNALEVTSIVLKDNYTGKTLYPVQKVPVSVDRSYYLGDTFFFKINSAISSSRGRSDILATADYLDLVSEFVFSRGERSIFGNCWMWDVEIEGATKEECQAWADSQGIPKPGSMRVHNEKIKWSTNAPDLKAHDASFDGQMLKTFCLGAQGFPEHFFGSGVDTNRSTAVEMHEPVVKMLASRQKEINHILRTLIDFALDKAAAYGVLNPKLDRIYEIGFPEISGKDMQRSGLTMLYLAQSLAIAVKNDWITAAHAAKVYAKVASTFGPDVEPVENPKAKPDPLPPKVAKREQPKGAPEPQGKE